MGEFNGMYLGIVVQNNDPDKLGRCKIFVPHLQSYLADEWLWHDKSIDREFKFIGADNNQDIQILLPRLKEVLPWANYAGAIFGGNASGRYNATTEQGYIQNHNDWNVNNTPATTFRPATQYSNAKPFKDAFTDPDSVNNTNPFAYAYTPSDYSTLAAGMFSIPNVGAHVWCFFENGEIDCPVYFASSYGTEDIKRIYTTNKHTDATISVANGSDGVEDNSTSIDYPGSYENIKKPELDYDSQVFRGKHVINSNKHSLELIDTDKHEILKLTHYSGSFKEFTNQANIEFAPRNHQTLIVGDKFETVRTTRNTHIEDDDSTYVHGDVYQEVGNYDFGITQKIKDTLKEIHAYTQLFDVRRVSVFEPGAEIPNPNPDFVPTPPGAGIGNIFAAEVPNIISTKQKRQKDPTAILPTSPRGFAICPQCKSKPYLFDSAAYLLELQPRILITSAASLMGNGLLCASPWIFQSPFANQGSIKFPIITPTAHDTQIATVLTSLTTDFGGIGYYAGGNCDICNSDLLLSSTKQRGFSPSSHLGQFVPELDKMPGGGLDRLIASSAPALAELEKQLTGGDQLVNIKRNHIVTVGTVMNDLSPIRVDPVGKLRHENVYVAPEEVYQSVRPAPHIEKVTVPDVPGGDYIVTATNKFKLLVGANGIDIKTYGNIEMHGAITNITSQQTNMSSQYETTVDGGERLMLRARKITINPKEHSPVLVDGALHVARNAIVQGGMYVDGQFGTPAIASVREYGETSDGIWAPPSFANVNEVDENLSAEDKSSLGSLAGGFSFVACGITAPLPTAGFPNGAPVTVLIPPHTHLYERPPSQLFNSLQALRMFFADPKGISTITGGVGASINDVKLRRPAAPVNDFATGEPKLAASSYREVLRDKIGAYIRANNGPGGEWARHELERMEILVSVLSPTNFINENTQVEGFMSVNIKTVRGAALRVGRNDAIGTWSVKFVINIDSETKEFVSQAKDPEVTQTSGETRSIGI